MQDAFCGLLVSFFPGFLIRSGVSSGYRIIENALGQPDHAVKARGLSTGRRIQGSSRG